ncbi:MAG: hypothetical protein HY774_07340 [Acidobacteria bacterium]|nr:hypothetical protein [Acidobacteriota bacterium]
MKNRWVVLIGLVLSLIMAQTAFAQDLTMVPGPSKKFGNYTISLRLPEGGLVAEEEQQIEFRVVDHTKEDPVLGPAAIVRANIESIVSMPSMPSMPKVEEVAHPEGVPGDYGLHPTFAHGGDYTLLLRITPPGGEPFVAEFPLFVADFDPAVKRVARPKPYRVELKTEPGKVKAGESTTLKLKVFGNLETADATGKLTGKRETVQIKQFDIAHEKYLHMIVVRKDLGFYIHEHPVIQPDGSFIYKDFVFPTPGEYQLFADVAPKGAGSQVLLANVKVEGKGKPEVKPITLEQTKQTEMTVDGVKVSRQDANIVPARKTSLLTFLLNKPTGEKVTDVEPYLGAMGHLIMINQDSQTFVHSHPDERDATNGKNGSITFLVRPPKPGLYRGFFEFQRNGKVSRAEFVFEVKAE